MDQTFPFIAFVCVSIVFLPLVLYKGLFTMPKGVVRKTRISFFSVCIAFFLYLTIAAFIPVFVAGYLQGKGLNSFRSVSIAQLLAFIAAAIVLAGFVKLHSAEVRLRIWGKVQPKLFLFLKGFGLTILCYPIVMLLVQCIHIGLEFVGIRPEEDQIAVAQMKSLQAIPWLFWCYSIAIVTIIPLIEELLFRGLLQNFLVDIFGMKPGVLLASLVFAGFHFSTGQGATNLELLVGLFIISYCIGVSYIKSDSLLVSMGMHAMFNGLSLVMMFLLKLS
jgi:membrane protease YdiL (CAAX protease family)